MGLFIQHLSKTIMNEIQVFNNPQFGAVRTAGTADNPMFCLADVCQAIGIGNSRAVKNRLEEDDVSLIDTIDNLGRTQQVTFVTESGLYDVIIRSDSEQAKPFRKWVTSEVLPSISLVQPVAISVDEVYPAAFNSL